MKARVYMRTPAGDTGSGDDLMGLEVKTEGTDRCLEIWQRDSQDGSLIGASLIDLTIAEAMHVRDAINEFLDDAREHPLDPDQCQCNDCALGRANRRELGTSVDDVAKSRPRAS